MLKSVAVTCLTIAALCVGHAQSVSANVNYEVRLRDGQIIPTTMSARLNEMVNIRVVNEGSRPHNLVIKDFFIFTHNLKPGEDVNVSFTPDKKGTFDYYSDVNGRPEPGMQGQFRVQ